MRIVWQLLLTTAATSLTVYRELLERGDQLRVTGPNLIHYSLVLTNVTEPSGHFLRR